MAGGKGGGKGRKGGKGALSGVPDRIKSTARGLGNLEFGGAIHGDHQEVRRQRNQQRVIDRAFQEYQKRLDALQGAQVDRSNALVGQEADQAKVLERVGANVTDQATAEAARRAALLGQGSQVADAAAALGGEASLGRQGVEAARLRSDADVGLARFSNFGRLSAAGKLAEIEAHSTQRGNIADARSNLKSDKEQRGAAVIKAVNDLMQQHHQNRIDRFNAETQRMSAEAQAALAAKQFHLDTKKFQLDRRNTIHDNRVASRHERFYERNYGGSGSGSAGSGLSPSEQQDLRKYVNSVNSVIAKYRQLRKKGMSVKQAKHRAERQTSTERWMVEVAAQVVDNGGLTRQGRHLVKGHLPSGAGIPKPWR